MISKKKTLKYFSKNKYFLKLHSSEINDNLNLIKNGELKIIFSKLLCEESKRLCLSELILEKIFLKKVTEFNLINELIDSEINLNIEFNSFSFFFSCNACKIIPKIELIDNLHVLFSCSKCHIFESEKIDKLIKLNSKWIKSFILKSSFFNDSHNYILNLYKKLLNEKIYFIKENIKYIQSFKIHNNNESRKIYYETIINILTVFFENIKFGKYIVKLNIVLTNTINKDVNHINEDISAKFFFFQEEQEDNSNKEKESKISIEENNYLMIQEKNINNISFVDKRFNSSIEAQRGNFIILINQLSEQQKIIMKNYVVNSFSNEYSKYNI